MCKVYNTVGSLKVIKERLAQKSIDFKSIQELISFRDNYESSRKQITSQQITLITEERNNLNFEILELERECNSCKTEIQSKAKSRLEIIEQQLNRIAELEKGYIQEFTYSFKALYLVINSYHIKLFTNLVIYFRNKPKAKILARRRKRFQYLDSRFEEAVRESSKRALLDLEYKKQAIDEINSYIYGAIGEQKVVEELEQLSDDYILINDLCLSFTRGIYSKQDKQFIKSVQIDHLLVSPSGLFLIETKNWSKDSLENRNLHSPVDQIKRANYALFKILADRSFFKLNYHRWGERKVPIRNVVVLINNRPTEEFQYVKILTLNELLGYIEYFKPSLSNKETQNLAAFLNRKNSTNS